MRKFLTVVLVGVAGSALAACSTGGSGSSMGSMHGSNESANAPVVKGGREIRVSGSSFRFNPKTINIATNENVTIVLTSTDAEHDVTIDKFGHVVHADKDETARGGLNIATPGTYAMYCSVSGHRQAGMTGQVVVS